MTDMLNENDSFNLTYDPRAAGEIRRYHTWSVNRDQSVGEHSWQIMRIMLAVWPRCPRRLLIHAVIHDMPESAGDIPYPFKLLFPDLKKAMTHAETHVSSEQMKNGRPEIPRLSPYEHLVFKLCEWVEMWEFGLHEFNMGNKYAQLLIDRMQPEIAAGLLRLEGQHFADTQDARQHPGIATALRKYMKRRMEMEGTQE